MDNTAGELLTGRDFRRMINGAYHAFMCEHEYINSLNVFPVPDGDTGTNLLLTLKAVARAIDDAPDSGIGSLSKRAADNAIMGARGNSGVILAQIFRGIARGLAGREAASSSEVGKAFQYGILYAYRAVARPVEGTILTVAKGIARGARQAVRDNKPFADILTAAVNAGEIELARTPELLPALKAAGVVDAGGKGLTVFLRGCLEGLGGVYNSPETGFDNTLQGPEPEAPLSLVHPYCTEFIVRPCHIAPADAKQQLLSWGESLIIAAGPELLKVHIHSAHPGAVLELAMTWGTLHDIKIDTMADQHRHGEVAEPGLKGRTAVVSVAAGDGLAAIMSRLGAAIIIAGGQTMNPPVEDFINAIHNGGYEQYIILPNNKNIILAAQQVKKLMGDRVEVVPTENVPQGLAALVAFTAADDLPVNVRRMAGRLPEVRAAEITTAVRGVSLNGREIEAGMYIGLTANKIVAASWNREEVLLAMVRGLVTPATEIVSLYYGAGLDADEAGRLAIKLTDLYTELAVELNYGGQPFYDFILSAE